MANRFRLGQARQADVAIALQPAEAAAGDLRVGQVDAGLVEPAALEQKRLLQLECAIAGDGAGRALLVGGRRRPPA